jgi:hypothetical protein
MNPAPLLVVGMCVLALGCEPPDDTEDSGGGSQAPSEPPAASDTPAAPDEPGPVEVACETYTRCAEESPKACVAALQGVYDGCEIGRTVLLRWFHCLESNPCESRASRCDDLRYIAENACARFELSYCREADRCDAGYDACQREIVDARYTCEPARYPLFDHLECVLRVGCEAAVANCSGTLESMRRSREASACPPLQLNL